MPKLIWVIKADTLFNFTGGKWQGLRADPDEKLLDLLRREGEFVPRTYELEHDARYRQIVTRVTVRYKKRVSFHEVGRDENGEENRLEGLWVAGAQGHAEIVDVKPGEDIAVVAAEREFREEYFYEGEILERHYLGVLCVEMPEGSAGDDIHDVHIGLMYEFRGDSDQITSLEPTIQNLHFADISEIEAVHAAGKLEPWTKFMLDEIRRRVA